MRVKRRHALSLMASAVAQPLWAQGFAGLGQAAQGFSLPQPGTKFQFPRDHGPHPSFRIEWWYVTANLRTASGADQGVQWTLFRSALTPTEADGWGSPQVWFAHGAMTRADAHLVAERRARGGIGQAGVTPAPFAAWIDDWHMVSTAPTGHDPLSRLALTARGEDWRYGLTLTSPGPLVLHGDDGFSLKHERGQASHYYSQPAYQVRGVLHWPDGAEEVTGNAWLDREWSSQPLDTDQTGWDWFSLHLTSGAKLMVYRVRDATGGGYTPGAWIAPDGTVTPLKDGAIELAPLDHTKIEGRTIPTRWRIELRQQDLDLLVAPVNPNAWMGTGIAYWEGPVRVSGSQSGTQSETDMGRGYLEMTGYD